MSLDFDADDMPAGYASAWDEVVRRVRPTDDPAERKRQQTREHYAMHKAERAAYFRRRRESLSPEQVALIRAQDRASYARRKAAR